MTYYIGEDCIECGGCVSECPVACITEGTGTFVIDESVCTGCGKCKKVCPVEVIKKRTVKKVAAPTRDTSQTGNTIGIKTKNQQDKALMEQFGIQDKNILKAFKLKISKEITLEKLNTLNQLDWSEYLAEAYPNDWKPTKSLSGIENCIHLEVLSMDGNSISDLTPVSQLVHLVELWLVDNQITELQPLHNLNQLKILNLEGNGQLEHLKALSGLRQLEYLNISRTKIKDLAPLLEMPSIKELTCYAMDFLESDINRLVIDTLLNKGVKINRG